MSNRDYSQHWPPCGCVVCLDFSATCECCNRTFSTYPAYRRHITAQKKKQKRGPIDASRAAVVPDGLGFLKRITANAKNLVPYNLAVISRFCAALNDIRPKGAHAKFTKTYRVLQRELENGTYTGKLLEFKTHITEAQASAVLGVARSVNVAPGDVVALLLSYGLEHLANELRANAVAPPVATPNITKKIVTPTVSASEEYLQEKYPHAAKPVQHIELTEYSRPTPVSPKDTRAIPRG